MEKKKEDMEGFKKKAIAKYNGRELSLINLFHLYCDGKHGLRRKG